MQKFTKCHGGFGNREGINIANNEYNASKDNADIRAMWNRSNPSVWHEACA